MALFQPRRCRGRRWGWGNNGDAAALMSDRAASSASLPQKTGCRPDPKQVWLCGDECKKRSLLVSFLKHHIRHRWVFFDQTAVGIPQISHLHVMRHNFHLTETWTNTNRRRRSPTQRAEESLYMKSDHHHHLRPHCGSLRIKNLFQFFGFNMQWEGSAWKPITRLHAHTFFKFISKLHTAQKKIYEKNE